ncbi:MAG TPA: outer membrane lipoprotein chaperone LolA [Gammaproteobacteria bacterium]
MKKPVVSLLCLLLGLFYSALVLAGAAEQQLEKFFKQVRSMRAEFTQTVMNDNKRSVEKSQGVLQMQRPGKFHWKYQTPYEQQIVANGKKLWIYDVEMEQVIVKNLDLALGDTPAVLLSGDANIADRFEIKEITENMPGEAGLFWLQLTPKQQEAGFEKLLLAFSAGNLQIMELKDSFGQVTRITFSHLEQNPVINPSVFNFVPPAGVDVINETDGPENNR